MILKAVLAGIWGACLGYAGALFGFQGNWAMVSLIVGLFVAIFYLVIWMIDTA